MRWQWGRGPPILPAHWQGNASLSSWFDLLWVDTKLHRTFHPALPTPAAGIAPAPSSAMADIMPHAPPCVWHIQAHAQAIAALHLLRRDAIENLALAQFQAGGNLREPPDAGNRLRRIDALQAVAQLFRGHILRTHRGRHIARRLHDERGVLWPHDEIDPLVSGAIGPALGGQHEGIDPG